MDRSDFGHFVTKNSPKWPKSERSILKFTQHLTFEKLTKEVFTFKQNIGAKRMTSFSRQNLKNSKK